MKKLSLVALLVLLSACKSEKGDAIHAKVLLPSVSATCVRFEVRDPSGAQATQTRWLKRTDDDLQIAIFRGALPDTVELAARPYMDGDCEGGQAARTPNGSEEKVSATFLKDEITSVDMTLRPGTDGDGDGYVGTGSGGADCADAPGQGGVNPGVQEQCTDQTDLNCDGKKGCEACGANACIGPPTNLALTLQSSSVQSGTCTSATIQVKDANGADTRVTTATTVSLTANPTAGFTFFSNAGCTANITSVSLDPGQGSATFYFRAQNAGDVTISVAAGQQLQDSQVAQVVPGPGNRLVFTSPPRNVAAGTCSQVQFQSQDAQGNAASVTATTAVALSASPADPGFKFYSDTGCTTEVTSVNLAAGTSSGSFRFKSTKSGTFAVTLTATGLTGNSQNETINPGPPSVMVFTGPQTLPAGDCSNPVTIELRDSFGNPAPAASNTSITLNGSGGGLTFSTNNGCSPTTANVSIAQGATATTFRYRGTAAGPASIAGTASGLTTPTPLAVTITPGAPSVLVFTTNPQTRTAGSCSAIATVQLRDAFTNPIRVAADTPVALSASPSSGFQFFSDSSCTGTAVPSVNIPANGSDASFYFKGTIVGTGTVTISATVTGVPAATQSVTLNPGPPSVLVFSPLTVTMAAGACTQFTLLVQDTFGNSSPVSSNQLITFTPSPSAGFTFSPNTDCSSPATQFNVNSGQSSRVLYMRGTAVADVTVTASRSGFTDGTLTVKVNPGTPNKLFFLTAPQTNVLVGACSGITTVQVRDTFDNPTPVTTNTQIDLSGSSGGITFYSDASCNTQVSFVTASTGQNSASFYFKDTNAETVTITAASTGLTSATQTETINPLPPTALVFATLPQTVAATGCSGVTTVETWAGGTPTTVTTATTVTLSAPPAASVTFYSNSGCTTVATSVTIGVGQGSANFYFKGATPGTVTITAASTGLTSATQDETITALPTKLLLSTPARTTAAGVCSAVVTVQTADASNNSVPVATNTTVNLSQTGTPADTQFKFYSDSSCGTPAVTSVTIPARQNSVNLYYKGEKVRTVTLTAAATGLTSATQDHTMVAGNAAALTFATATPAQTLLAGTCSNLRTVETRDAFGNITTNGATITLSGSTTAEFFQDLNCTTPITGPITIPNGNSTTGFYFKGFTGGINANGTLTLTASGTGLTSTTQDETIIPTVRTGTCSMNNTSVNCPAITPALQDLSKAFLTFQATSSNTASNFANVRCFLNSLTQVRCERTGNGGGDVTIRWSVAEFPSGVTVQHLASTCGGDTTSVSLSNVTMNRTFLLLSSQRDATTIAGSSTRLAELVAMNRAEIRKTGGCTGITDNNHLQVVDFPGADVQRGLASIASGATSTPVNLATPVVPGRSILLYSYIADSTTTKICDRAVRGELAVGGGSVNFSRGEGTTANCAGSTVTGISWEVVQFPAGTVVQQVTQQLGAGTGSGTAAISSVDRSRTLVIGGGQWASGQLHGEGQFAGSDNIGEMRAQAWLTNDTTLNFARDASTSSATFTAYVIQFKP